MACASSHSTGQMPATAGTTTSARGACRLRLRAPAPCSLPRAPGSHAPVRRYYEALDRAGADSSVRVIVLTGAGKLFCAGADIGGLGAQSQEEVPGESDAFAGSGKAKKPTKNYLINHASTVPKPIIVAINGSAAGMGLSIACSCDIRFAAEGAKLTPAFSKRGLIAEHDLSWSLPHLIGTSRAMHWLMTSDVVLSEQAKEYGLVTEVYPRDELLPAVMAFAKDLAIK